MIKLFDNTFHTLQKKMDLHLNRHGVLSSNLANSETPNFIARDVSFGDELEKSLTKSSEGMVVTNALHQSELSGKSGAQVLLDTSMAVGADGNNVDLDITMGKLRSNQRGYSSAATLLTMKLRLLRAAASGRGSL